MQKIKASSLYDADDLRNLISNEIKEGNEKFKITSMAHEEKNESYTAKIDYEKNPIEISLTSNNINDIFTEDALRIINCINKDQNFKVEIETPNIACIQDSKGTEINLMNADENFFEAMKDALFFKSCTPVKIFEKLNSETSLEFDGENYNYKKEGSNIIKNSELFEKLSDKEIISFHELSFYTKDDKLAAIVKKSLDKNDFNFNEKGNMELLNVNSLSDDFKKALIYCQHNDAKLETSNIEDFLKTVKGSTRFENTPYYGDYTIEFEDNTVRTRGFFPRIEKYDFEPEKDFKILMALANEKVQLYNKKDECFKITPDGILIETENPLINFSEELKKWETISKYEGEIRFKNYFNDINVSYDASKGKISYEVSAKINNKNFQKEILKNLNKDYEIKLNGEKISSSFNNNFESKKEKTR